MLGGGQDRPDDLRDPLSSETDMKMAKSDNSLHPFDLLLIKLEEGCHKNRIQCSICGLEFIAKEDLKSHMTEEHSSYGTDHLRDFPEKVKTNHYQKCGEIFTSRNVMKISFPDELLQVSVLQGAVFGYQELARPHEIGDTFNG